MCDCITRIDELLVAKNAKLPVAINFSTGKCDLIFRLDKIESKKKLSAAFMAPSFCPFCAEKLTTGSAT